MKAWALGPSISSSSCRMVAFAPGQLGLNSPQHLSPAQRRSAGDRREGLDGRSWRCREFKRQKEREQGEDEELANSLLQLPRKLLQCTACHGASPETPCVCRLSLLSSDHHGKVPPGFIYFSPFSDSHPPLSPPPRFPWNYTSPRKHSHVKLYHRLSFLG